MGGHNSGRRMTESNEKPKITKVIIDGVACYSNVAPAARWIAENYGVGCTVPSIENVLRRQLKPKKLTLREIMTKEFPYLFKEQV